MVSSKKILDRVKSVTGYNQKLIASEIFGISAENLSNKIRRNSIDVNVLVSWAAGKKIDLNWLLTGEGEPYLPAVSTGSFSAGEVVAFPKDSTKGVETSETDLLGQFRDKSYAKDIILMLAQLERVKPESYKQISTFIAGVSEGIRIMSPGPNILNDPDRRIAIRREKDDPEKVPQGKDRRSGKDRRAVAGG